MNQSAQVGIKCRGVIVHEGRLLVVRHPQDTSFAALPGGKLEDGEDPKACVARELKEELGVDAEVGRLLYVNTFTDFKGRNWVEFLFEVLNSEAFVDFEKNDRSHAHELSEVTWIEASEDVKVLPEEFAKDFKAGTFPTEVKFIKDL